MSKILVLEDESMLNEMICEYLNANHHETTSAKSYEKALNLAYENDFDLWIFDVKVIGGNGFELLEELRNANKLTPCIFTTSLNDIKDLNKGFLSGCDDYLKKPFELAELLLRVNNLIKRNFAHKHSKIEDLGDGLSFDIYKKTLYKNGEVVSLSNKESRLLALFLQNKNRVLSREEIYSSIWDYDEVPSELSLRVYIRNLRKYFGKKIISKPKLGYIYA
ncbi:two-component system response regulator [Campylobacter ureolyticus]|uniref:Two-component system response regulator n=1 Tax=Campylobacter ureolyticus TaxID=827 RepID=A0A2I1NBR5_9BACT|nr:response regulator transcription factor [Campylobacter ureolyticus]PKZ29786.1 two-component system response regulator [Campylobacter ureolyticus]